MKKHQEMKDKLSLSICIPTYNGGKHIAGNLDIIIDQIIQNAITDVEIVISDNCSTDDTPQLIEKYIQRYPNLIRYSRNEKNILFNGNILKCCDLAKGEYIHFMGDDDFYCENGLIRLLEVARKSEYDLIMASNNWLLAGDSLPAFRNENDHEIFGDDIILSDKNEFIEKIFYRMWCVSDIVLRKDLTRGVKAHLPPVRDWIQLGMVSYIASKGKSFYCFSSSRPLVSIRLFDQKWLNNSDAPRIFLNNLKTMSYLPKMGYDLSVFDAYKKWFFELAISDLTYFRSLSFIKNILYILKYRKYYRDEEDFREKFIHSFLFFKNK